MDDDHHDDADLFRGHLRISALKPVLRLSTTQPSAGRALMNMTAFDCVVASHAAKFFYWLLRPIMADPLIKLAIPMPNFPSYASNQDLGGHPLPLRLRGGVGA